MKLFVLGAGIAIMAPSIKLQTFMFLVQITPRDMFPVFVGFVDDKLAASFARAVEAFLGDNAEVRTIQPFVVENDEEDFAAALTGIRAYSAIRNGL